jgi:hypothetical protein
MEQKQQVSIGELVSINTPSKWKTIIFTVLLTTLILISTYIIYNAYTKTDMSNDAHIVTLTDIIIAYAPETRRIIFLDRKSGQVQFSLSDSVSLAIFALKSNEVVTDYSSSLKNENSQKTKK